MTPSIRPYQPDDFDAVYALWQATLGASWVMSQDFFKTMISGMETSRPDDNVIAEREGQVVGFAATQISTDGKAGVLLLIMVHPAEQRQGAGRLLQEAAVTHLRGSGVESIRLAAGSGEYFWCGVPQDALGAVEFFKACGWKFTWVAHDLIRDLSDYHTPAGVLERVEGHGITIRAAASADEAESVLAFEQRVFPEWLGYFEGVAAGGQYRDILAAWDGSRVVGSLLLEMPDPEAFNSEARWHAMIGEKMGTIGAVGVDDAYRERGIGLTLVAVASEILKARGAGPCAIGWTNLLSFYGRLGYESWRSYDMAEEQQYV